jgi:hypothetical protein
MAVSLKFDTTHQYTEAKDGINVPIALGIGSQSVELLAKGANFPLADLS